MPKMMSFALTTTAMYLGRKYVTRRTGWNFAKPDDVYTAVEKAQGLKKGQHVKKIGDIRIVTTEKTNLGALIVDKPYGYREVILEGFSGMTPSEFCDLFQEHNSKITYHTKINRIQFVPLYSIPDNWVCPECGYQYEHRLFVSVLFNMECHRCLRTTFADFTPEAKDEKPFPFVANRWAL